MSYTPAIPKVFPHCRNCHKNKVGCPEGSPEARRKGNWTVGCCSEWKPAHKTIFNTLAWLDAREEILRFKIAYQLDKLDRWCWADLVMWAERYKPFSEVGRVKKCLVFGDYPYCGKCKKFLPPEGRAENLADPKWSSEKKMWVERVV